MAGLYAQVEPELRLKLREPERRDLDRAVGRAALQPAELEEAIGDRRSERTRDVAATFAPVEARPDERTTTPRQRLEIDAELREPPRAAELERLAVVHEDAVPLERGGQLDTEPSREMVVAGARVPDRLAHGCLPQRPHGPCRSDRRQRLDRRRNRRVGQPEVAVAPGSLAGDEAAVDEPRQMPTRCRRSDASTRGELASRQRLVGHQCLEQRRARGLADQSRGSGEIDVTVHATPPRRPPRTARVP